LINHIYNILTLRINCYLFSQPTQRLLYNFFLLCFFNFNYIKIEN